MGGKQCEHGIVPVTDCYVCVSAPTAERTVTVCAACLRACCWQGILMCEDADVADITEKTISELRRLDLEHEDYWLEVDDAH